MLGEEHSIEKQQRSIKIEQDSVYHSYQAQKSDVEKRKALKRQMKLLKKMKKKEAA